AVYNWVEDARALWLDGPDGPELTPAGKVFAAHDSRPAFSRETEHVHKWKICPPRMESISKNRTRVRINFYDINGETGAGYKVQRRINGGEWTEIAIIRPDTDYKVAQSTYFTDKDLVGGFHEYRFKGIAPSGRLSIYSRVIGIEVPVSGIDAAEVGNGLSVFARGGEIVIESESEGRAEVYRPDGRLVRQVDYTPGETTVGGLSSGIYIVAGQKVVL
ncbi:MAG: hypothetical protein K2F63_06920, partial [Muribaculaceae bacterium]|nr:hypothetical protein [Muribaculaceae bacterium]